MHILYDSKLQYTANHNQYDTSIATCWSYLCVMIV